MTNGFFAYSGRPASSGDCIEEAIIKINKNQNIPAYLRSWRDYAVNGNLIANICGRKHLEVNCLYRNN